MSVVKVLEGYRVTIPGELREKLRLKLGDYVILEPKNDYLVLKPAKIVPREEHE